MSRLVGASPDSCPPPHTHTHTLPTATCPFVHSLVPNIVLGWKSGRMGGGLSRMEGGARAARAGAVTKHSLRDAATAPDAGGCGGRVLGEARRGFLGRRDGAGGVAADLSAGETGWCKKGCCYDDDDFGGGGRRPHYLSMVER